MLKLTIFLYLGTCLVLGNPVQKTDDSYFLPDAIVPSSYVINIVPTLPASTETASVSTFTGSVTIEAKRKTDITTVDQIVLHSLKITKTTVTVNNEPIVPTFDEKKNFMILKLTDTLKTAQIYSIKIDYTGEMASDMYGFYLSSYDIDATNREYIGSTQMESTFARRVFPCFDEPKYKATFEITIKAPTDYKVLSNMALQADFPNAGTFTFKKTPPMSTYLVAFVVSKFEASSTPQDPKLNVWSRKEAKEQTKFAQEMGPKLLSKIGEYLGMDYYTIASSTGETITKMDMVAIPDFAAGAMENWGLLTYRETALLFDKEESTAHDKQRVACVIAHEQAHQWFGDLVTLSWWDNTWLNEGFATYFEYHTVAGLTETDLGCAAPSKAAAKPVEDCWDMKSQFVIEEHQTALAADSVKSSTPLTNSNTKTPNEIQANFGTMSYNKGGSIIRMMRSMLGDTPANVNIFKASLKEYLTTKKFSNAVPSDLFAAMQKTLADNDFTKVLPPEKTVSQVMDSWINQAGYPLITVTRKENKFTFKQERFLLTSETAPKEDKHWYVPIFYETHETVSETETKYVLNSGWVTDTSSEITIENADKKDWFIFNFNAEGYYRVQYDAPLLEMISKVLNDDKKINTIEQLNRAQLVDDMLNLARAGKMTYVDALKFLQFLKKENNYFTWASAFADFRFLMQRFSEDDKLGKSLRAHILDLMKGKLYSKDTKFDKAGDSTLISTYNRVNALSWACNLGDEDCNKNAQDLFKKWMPPADAETKNPIPVDVRSIVYCSALRNEKVETEKPEKADPIPPKMTPQFQFLWDKFSKSNVAAEKITILNALGCTKNTANLNIYLKKSLDEKEVRKQDANYVFTSVYTGSNENVGLALGFLKDNWADIKTSYGGMNALSKVVSGLADHLTKQEDVDKLNEIIKDKEEVQDVKNTVKETMDANMKWSKARQEEVKEYLCGVNGAYEVCEKKPDGAAEITASFLTITFGLVALYFGRF